MLLPHNVEDFSQIMHVVNCYIQVGDEYLIVKRHPKKPYGEYWSFPGGKIDPGESPKQACIRETLEEVGINLEDPKEIETHYVRYPEMDFKFTTFYKKLDSKPKIDLKLDEHTDYLWAPPQVFRKMKLVPDEIECFESMLNKL